MLTITISITQSDPPRLPFSHNILQITPASDDVTVIPVEVTDAGVQIAMPEDVGYTAIWNLDSNNYVDAYASSGTNGQIPFAHLEPGYVACIPWHPDADLFLVAPPATEPCRVHIQAYRSI